MKAGSDEQKKQGVWRVWCSCLGKSDNIVVRSQDCWHFWPGMVPATWVKAVLDTVVEGKLGTSPCSIPHLVPRGMCLLLSFVPLEGQFSSVQFSYSVVSDSLRPHESQHARPPCPSPSPRVHSNSPPSSQWCHPAISSSVVPFSSCPQSPPSIRVFSNESTLLMRWPNYWSFSFSIIPSKEHPGLISFRMDWLDLLAGQGTLKSLLQHHSSKASILRHSAFITVQLWHPYMTTEKTMALTRWTLVVKVMSLLFNLLSRLVITFFPRSKCPLISWLQSPSAVILEPPENKGRLRRLKFAQSTPLQYSCLENPMDGGAW